MTKNVEEFSVADHIEYREYILSRDNLFSDPKDWIREETKIDLVLEVKTNYHQGQSGIVIRIKPLSRVNSQFWVRISNGLNKIVEDLTVKSRITYEEENESGRTRQSSSRELRIDSRFQNETERSSAKTKLESKSKPIQQPSLKLISILERR